jgi:hypothetical protein
VTIRDIIVTIPKSKLAEVEAEEADVERRLAAGEAEDLLLYYWQMGRVPKNPIRRIYFVWDNAIRAYHEVLSVEEPRIWMKAKIHPIEPIPMKGFRGYRYYP